MSTAAALPDRSALDQRLASAAEVLGVPLAEAQRARLLDFVALLAKWNATYNLTAVRDPADMLAQHVLDSLAALAPLNRERSGPKVLDVGSGGGLPGVVWAIAEPAIDVTCIDAVGKKAAFIQQAAGSLGLANLHGLHGRVEQARVGPFDVVASRAFASLSDFVDWTGELLAPSGVWLAMKGKAPDAELATLGDGAEVFHVEPLQVPGLAAERCIVWMRKASQVNDHTKSMRSPSSQDSKP